MPQTPEDLSAIIRRMAKEQSSYANRELERAAEDRIAEIPSPYRFEEKIPVDLSQLESTISDVIYLAASFTEKIIALRDMERALIEVKCHYLWFC